MVKWFLAKSKICKLSPPLIKEVNRRWASKEAPLMTKWSKDIDPENPHPEYPRPQLVRKKWRSLNGIWDFQIRG